ncbi:MAG: metallophosphoesterase family protein [Kiritimatiellae bacterium]|nr:metallophosphoesterase family protein [Kiritimatiellia bacterium]
MSKKFAILGDIHSNWEALCAVLKDAEAQGVTHYVCVGDIVGYNADPVLCLDKIRELNTVCVRGNHDHYCSHEESLEDFHSHAAHVMTWTKEQLSEDQLEYLRHLPYEKKVAGFTLVHSTLDMPEKWGYVFGDIDAEISIENQTTSLCFHGHTHVPVAFIREYCVNSGSYDKIKIEFGKKFFINVGSVGQPRDRDPRAAYVIYDFSSKTVELRRVDYDFRLTQQKVLEAGLPERLATRLAKGE